MEVARRFWHWLGVLWLTVANVLGDFLEETAFRLELAFDVLAGRVPIETEKRSWNRATETPALVDVYSWVDDRLIFSVIIWPSLESSPHDADYVYRQRVDEVKEAIARGAADQAWVTRFETDYGLRWDHRRECWVDSEGFAYDGSRFGAGSRGPHAA